MELKPGYKEAEVKAIPADWKLVVFDSVFRKVSTKENQIQTSEYLEFGRFPIVDQGQSQIVGFSERADKVFHVPDSGVVVFGDHTCIVKYVDFDFIVGADGTQVLTAREGHLARFHAYALEHRGIEATGYNRHFKFLKEHLFEAPALAEQGAIAEALSDADELLGGLDRLIAKKRDLKQAAMQQLLTGQTRLPGFDAEWIIRSIGQLGKVVTGGTPPTSVSAYWGGKHPWITPTDIGEMRDINGGDRSLTDAGLAAIRELPPNTLLVTSIASIGKNAILRCRGGCNQQINAIIPNPEYDVDYLYYLIEHNGGALKANAGMTATLIISRGAFERIQFCVAPTRSEQEAIASILLNMDNEVEVLQQRREKTRSLKQAMMQELLTGKTRLVPSEAANA